ncbi:MAG: hypothetical protein M0T73_06515 [Deltaproteobacteria bacterium]|nr:hypothetical protein [Deltaproteobacteria bacterium]
MRSQIKASATKKERLRSSGATSQIEVSNSGLERLDHLIGQMVDLCETLAKGMDRASTADNVNSFYKLSQSLAGLTRSRVDIEKLNLETKGLHDRAFQSIQNQIRAQLQGRPELVAELIEISEAVNEQILTSKQ